MARVLFDPEVARWRIERGALPLAKGYALEEVGVGGTDWFVGEILSHRGYAEVLEPEDLRTEVAARAKKLKAALAKRPARAAPRRAARRSCSRSGRSPRPTARADVAHRRSFRA